MGYLTLFLMGILSYLVVPAIGPEKFFADKYTHDLQGQMLSRSGDYIINVGRVGYDCFPVVTRGDSLAGLLFYIYNYRRKFFIPAAIYVLVMCFATLYLRYHYAIDVMASFVYAPAAYFLNDFFLRHWPGERIQEQAAKEANPQPAEKIDALTK